MIWNKSVVLYLGAKMQILKEQTLRDVKEKVLKCNGLVGGQSTIENEGL